MASMNAAVLCVGDEILRGFTLNTNSLRLASFLHKKGWNVIQERTVSDNTKDIASAVKELSSMCSLLLVTGGLGPTLDDRTIDGVARALSREIVISRKMKMIAEKRMKYKTTELLTRQSRMIKGAKLIDNFAGTAVCQKISFQDCDIYLLPGVPFELAWILENRLNGLIGESKLNEFSIRMYDVPETRVHRELMKVFTKKELNEVSFLPSAGSLLIVAEKKSIIEHLKKAFSGNIVSLTDEPIEKVLLSMLFEKNLSLSVAESCTGGMMGSMLTAIDGSSKSFKGGAVVYSNEAKINVLGVEKMVLERYGAVSREAAESMARNACIKFKSDCSISVTGIAGPGGGTKSKPVGLVYISTCHRSKISTEKFEFKGSRDAIRTRSSVTGFFNLLRRVINE